MEAFVVEVAGFAFGAVARTSGLSFLLSESLSMFQAPAARQADLSFDVSAQDVVQFSPRQKLMSGAGPYVLGVGDDGSLLFQARAQPPFLSVVAVDPAFSRGSVTVPTSVAKADGGFYPLQSLDLVITVCRFSLVGGLVLHSAAVCSQDAGYLFLGPSGAGKSTMADLWASQPGVEILGEDTSVVVRREGVHWVYGTPWHLRLDRCSPRGARLKAVFVLSHGAENRLGRLLGMDAATAVLHNCYLPLYLPQGVSGTLEAIDSLSQQVPVYELAFLPDAAVLDVVRQAVRS